MINSTFKNGVLKRLFRIILPVLFSLLLLSTGCGGNKDLDPNRPIGAKEKRKKNIEEGRGASIGNILGRGRGATNYEFSTSNPLWRASLETLDFIPLSNVDYSGGMIITDWYTDNNSTNNDSIKITIRFLGNDIRSESLKIIVHKKTCINNKCKVNVLSQTKIKEELHSTILRKAALLQKASKGKKKK